nr:folylpolyglutamate synthase/dihydrofolate synthase family protein [Carbonactinospora thermoautotrophica]
MVEPPRRLDPVSKPVDPQVAEEFRRVEKELTARFPESRPQPSLDRIRALVDLLGEPQRAYPVIHVTGTNGKTSTSRMIDTLLRAFNLRTGRYTSPHVESVTERISIDGEPISVARFVETYDDVAPYVRLVDAQQPVRMSYFEVLVGMAYAAFADAPVDVAVVEVGMGGAWDATNVADGQVAVVTPISLDHTHYLGDTTEQIAREKAGIIKPGTLAILAQQPLDAAQVLLRRAVEVDATVAREGLEFGVLRRDVAMGGQLLRLQGLGGVYDEVFLPLHGAHQAHNASCALAAVEAFFGGKQQLDADVVRQAFATVTSPGRLEVVRRGPTVLLDAAHNPAGARATAEALTEAFTFTRLVGVIGMMGDKDVQGVLEAFEPVLDQVVVTQAATDRALPAGELAEVAREVFGEHRVEVALRMDDALDTAIRLAEEEGELGGGGVLVTGSVVTVGEARRLVRKS